MVTSSVDPPPTPSDPNQTPSYIHKKSFFRRLHLLCLFFTIAVLGAAGLTVYRFAIYQPKVKKDAFGDDLPDNSAMGTARYWAPLILAFAFVAYWIEVFVSPTRRYAFNVLTDQSTLQFIEYVQSQPADLWMKVECYHYETRTRTVTYTSNGQTQTRTETYQQKVVTYAESTNFPFSECLDVSANLAGWSATGITKLRNYKTWVPKDQYTRDVYNAFETDFKNRNMYRDTHMDFWSGMEISGYKDRVLSLVDLSRRPFLLGGGWYLLCSLLLGSWFYRIWMDHISQRVNFTFVKQIGV